MQACSTSVLLSLLLLLSSLLSALLLLSSSPSSSLWSLAPEQSVAEFCLSDMAGPAAVADVVADGDSKAAQEAVQVLVPRSDKRGYRVATLPNRMQALLISDKDTDKAAAAVDVRVGSFSDPDELPGLAHFLEHMLFYSSEKYPEEDGYSKWLQEHGGRSNAYTSGEDTNYHFDVNAQHLPEALDRFAQFFLCPVFDPDAVDREVHAVDSEHGKNKQSDVWILNQLSKHTASEHHPYHKFGTGNLQTLVDKPKEEGIDVRLRMIDLYKEKYSANLMKLVIYGQESLDELEALAVNSFSGVGNSNKSAPAFPGQPCTEDELKVLVRTVPVAETHSLQLSWLVPSEQELYDKAPCQYVGHLVGHEGTGSLFALLKSQGWVTSLHAGEYDSSKNYTWFIVSVELTNEGHEHVKDVVQYIFQYLRLVREQGVQQWIFDEVRAVAEMKFHFRDKSPPFSYATYLASNMQIYPAADVLAASHLPRVYDEAAIRSVLTAMTPDNVRIMWASKRFDGELQLREPWYETQYSLEQLGQDWLEASAATSIDERLQLPQANPYIPTNFQLKEHEQLPEHPVLYRKSLFSRLWYKPDTRFSTPKAYVYIDFTCPEAYISPANAVLTRFFAKLTMDYLNEVAYLAEIAGLAYNVQTTIGGFQVIVWGYNDKLGKLTQTILDHIANFDVREDRFAVIKEKSIKDFGNFKYDQPYQHAIYEAANALEQRRWHIKEYQQVAPALTPQHLRDFVPRLLSHVNAECFIIGNLRGEEATELVKSIDTLLKDKMGARPPHPGQLPERRIVKLPEGANYCLQEAAPNAEDLNSALELYFQVGRDQPRLNVLAQLFVQVARQAAFHQLRSVEQLGYIVYLNGRVDYGIRGVHFVLQSTAHDAAYLDQRVESFLVTFGQTLASMTDDAFKEHVEALAASKLEKFKNLGEEAQRHWGEIETGTYMFDRVNIEVAELRQLALGDLLQFFQNFLSSSTTKRRRLTSQVFGKNHRSALHPSVREKQTPSPAQEAQVLGFDGKAEQLTQESSIAVTLDDGSQLILDVQAFKRSQDLYGSVKSSASFR
eukprot:jgi/Chlat1/7067/Chrsp57S06767